MAPNDKLINLMFKVGSKAVEDTCRKNLSDSSSTKRTEEGQETEKTNASPQKQDTNLLKQIDNLGQNISPEYRSIKRDIENGNYLRATEKGVKIGCNIVGGDVKRVGDIVSDGKGILGAIKDSDLGRGLFYSCRILKNAAGIVWRSFRLSPKEQSIYDQAMEGFDNLSQATRYERLARQAVDRGIERARNGYIPEDYSKSEQLMAEVNETLREHLTSQTQTEHQKREEYSSDDLALQMQRDRQKMQIEQQQHQEGEKYSSDDLALQMQTDQQQHSEIVGIVSPQESKVTEQTLSYSPAVMRQTSGRE